MKTLIVYATKHGATRDIAERLAKQLHGADVYDLAKPGVPAAAAYDCVVVGSPLYAGMARKEARKYLKANEAALQGKKLGLFLSGVSTEPPDSYLKSNYPASLVQHAATATLGAKFDPASAGGFERFIMKLVAKATAPIDTINDDAIAAFAAKLSQ